MLIFLIVFFAFVPSAMGEGRSSINPQDAQLIRRLIADASALSSFEARVEYISGRLAGSPYLASPLIGSAGEPEVLVARMDGFDCFTYVESVLALAGSRSVDDYLRRLREIRYINGEVEWRNRLHYTIDWSQYHVQRGTLIDLTQGEETLTLTKRLSFVQGLDPKTVSFRYFPKNELNNVAPELKNGDLIYFISARRNLDIFHIGFVVREGERLMIRHARKMRGRVVEEDLADFCRRSKTSGFIINRPAAPIK